MSIKSKDKKVPDIRVIFLLGVFLGIPIIVFISWLVANNELGNLFKMFIIIFSVFLVTLLYRFIRYLFTVKTDKEKMSFIRYIFVQSISLIITLIIIGLIVFWIQFI